MATGTAAIKWYASRKNNETGAAGRAGESSDAEFAADIKLRHHLVLLKAHLERGGANRLAETAESGTVFNHLLERALLRRR